MGVKIAPSILSADFGRLADEVEAVERSGLAQLIHVDVMDGVFVPNLTVGPLVVQAVKRHTSLPLDVHLMITEPHRYIEQFAEAGASYLTVHVEACPHLHRDVELIRRRGLKAGVALNPATPASLLEEVIDLVDLILVMTVDPGFGGQAFLTEVLPKVAKVRNMVDRNGARAQISVDGGVNSATAPSVVAAGAHILVAGSAVFHHPKGIAKGIEEIKDSLSGAVQE